MSSRTLQLTEQLLSHPSVTPEDAHCQKLVAERLKPLGVVFEQLDRGPADFRVSSLWAVRKLLATGASFDALAMERSTDAATRFNGGDLGYFTVDVMPEAYAANLKTSKVGDIVGPFGIEGGWAILKIEDRRLEQPITFEAARPQIVRFLTYDQVRDLLEKLRSRAKVQTLIGAPQDVPGQPKEPADAPKTAPQTPATKAAPAASAAPAKAAQP